MRKKATSESIGQGLVRKLTRSQPDLIHDFVIGRKEYLEARKLNSDSGTDRSNKNEHSADEKATAAKRVVISVDTHQVKDESESHSSGAMNQLRNAWSRVRAVSMNMIPNMHMTARHQVVNGTHNARSNDNNKTAGQTDALSAG